MKKINIKEFVITNFKIIIYVIVLLLLLFNCGGLKNPDGDVMVKLTGYKLFFGYSTEGQNIAYFNVWGLFTLLLIIGFIILEIIKKINFKYKNIIEAILLVLSSIFMYLAILSPRFAQDMFANSYVLTFIGFVVLIIPTLITIGYIYFNFINIKTK